MSNVLPFNRQSQSPAAFSMPQPNEGIELLVSMAKEGKIDPWNVDLVTVADQYLLAVNQLGPLPGKAIDLTGKETPLRLTGKTLLYLAVLLRMKSDLLAGYNPFAVEDLIEDASFDELVEYDEDGEPIDAKAMSAEVAERFKQALRNRYGTLESVLKRRTSAKQPRIRAVTLDDLIRELKKVEAMERENASRKKIEAVDKRRGRDFSNLTTEDITALAHEEFQESMVIQVQQVLEAHLPAETDSQMSLTDLMELSGLSRVVCFLSLLFLEAREAIVTHQPYFYADELYVSWEEPGQKPDAQSINPLA